MKLLTVSALLCSMMTLTTAAAVPDEEVSSGEEGLITSAKSHLVNTSSGCPHGWTPFNHRCFIYIPTPVSWSRAERNCLSMGANLASVHSIMEYNEVQKLTATHGYKETWIGGTDAAGENVWLWSDGSPFRYTHWCPGEPSDFKNQHCLQINYGDSKCWDDVQCYSEKPSVCTKKI